MTTLLITHPACLEHLNAVRPSRAAGPAARDRTRPRAASASRTSRGSRRPRRRLESIALCHPMDYVDGDPRRDAEARPECGSTPTPRCRRAAIEAALRAVGGATARGRRGDDRKGRQRLRRHAAARPPCRDRAADGLLPVQQCRDRRPPRAEEARRRARRHHRLRRASRQRLAGNLLVGPDRDVLLDPPDAALPRHRRGVRARRAQHDRQCAAARRATAATEFREAFETVDPAAAARFPPGPDRRSRRASTPTCAIRSPICNCSRPISAGSPASSWRSAERQRRRPGRSRCSKAATTSKAWRIRPPPMSPR